MQALLMHPDRDFDVAGPLPPYAAIVRQDLALDVVLDAMAAGDACIEGSAARVLLAAAGTDVAGIRYRQAAVADAIAHPGPVRQMYALANAALEEKRKHYWGFVGHHPGSILYSAIHVLRLFMDKLQVLRVLAEAEAPRFRSAGFGNLFAMLQREFDDAYLARVRSQLGELEFKRGALLSARLGADAASDGYVLRRPVAGDGHWWQALLEHAPSACTVRIAQRDMLGAKTLEAMRDRGIGEVATALAQSVEHIQGFFEMLRAELAFHVGCCNLHARLATIGVPTCFPDPQAQAGMPGFRAEGLRDVALALASERVPVGNTVAAADKPLLVITGANQGGKSTFLRSLGLALLMLRGGMFVAAEGFSAGLFSGLFTHFKRAEDATMRQGKLDEELARLSAIADVIRPGAWLLSNESFASTNEREGSELARQMVEALRERRIRVACVTHLHSLACNLHAQHRGDALFLRAEHRADGTRTFRLLEGAPAATSYGPELYREVFGAEGVDDPEQANAAVPVVAGGER